MTPDAIALANYFVDLAKENNDEIKQLGLMKRVYITHGFCLAILNKSAINPRFDNVEAWKLGPVIPSVYHSFKHHKNEPITEKSVFVKEVKDDDRYEFITPELQDEDVKKIANFVWGRYKGFSDTAIVELTHNKGTPWHYCYEEGKNNPIPDLVTRAYYSKLIKR